MKFCVIGLGRFGYQLAVTLAENGMEVMAVDSNETIVASIKDKVTHAICMHVTDEESLYNIGVEEMDTIIVAMGENFAQTILITALLKKHIKVPYVIARAINDIHKEILILIGADRVILPEKDIGIKLADSLSSPFTDLVRLTKNFSISQIVAPKQFVGKTIGNLNLFKNYQVHCLGAKKQEKIISIDKDYVVIEGDRLIFSGYNQDLEKITKL
ncbi:TrkA family potassium uptake protein [Candidatus Dependentiae bacterium]|nr:MAG: TrkA family potassium uptake protein [Candidatus Dependentiae bacterium]